MPKIKCYVSEAGRSEVQEHVDNATDALQAELMVAIEYLRDQPRQNWTRPKAAKLSADKKEFRDYFEIRFVAENTQQRPIGYFGPGENEFTILIWVIEKDRKFIPKEWRSMADTRRTALDSGKATNRDLTLENDED